MLALGVASAAIYALADRDVLTLNGQSQGILFILAVGAATDYSLLVVARFREELRDHESKYDAMRRGLPRRLRADRRLRARPSSSACCACCSPTSPACSGLGPGGRDRHRRRDAQPR